MVKKPETETEAVGTFEDDLERLEDAVAQLESGRLDLDTALKRFEEGVGLTRTLRARLDAAEGRIEQLLANGEVREVKGADVD